MLGVEPAEPAPKKKRLSRLEERREERVRAAAGGGSDSGSAKPQAFVTGRRVLIGREVVYLAEQGQLDVDASTCRGLGIGGAPTAYARRRARSSSCGNAVSKATNCQSKRNFSALANLIGYLRSRMLASEVERMVFIWLNRPS